MKFYTSMHTLFKLDASYLFNIFLYDNERDARIVAIYPGTKITQEHLDEWEAFVDKGAKIQVHYGDIEEYCDELEVGIAEIQKWNHVYFFCKELEEKRAKKYTAIAKEPFEVRNEFIEASEKNNFTRIITRVRAEILTLPLNQSKNISFCTEIVDKLFTKDILPVRSACVAYFIALQNNLTDTELLADIIIGSLIKDVGHSLIKYSVFESTEDLMDNNLYLKHPMLSIYLLTKCGHEFSSELKRIILEHHEDSRGMGFPRGKKEDHIDIKSFIVSVADQIVFHSSSKGSKKSLVEVINIMNKRLGLPGFNISYPVKLTDSLYGFIPLESTKKD
jgi:HD-GYP domain-containing protein (c-di-GMP phosphodiesterase class II)